MPTSRIAVTVPAAAPRSPLAHGLGGAQGYGSDQQTETKACKPKVDR